MPSSLVKAIQRSTEEYRVGVPWPSLGGVITPLRGNLINILGAPGAGKSAIALNWCLSLDEPSLIISLDTDLTTQAIRAISILTQTEMDKVSKNPSVYGPFLEKAAYRTRVYDTGGAPREIWAIIKAEEQFWGNPPALTVVDNVSNIIREGGYEEFRRTFVDLHRIARSTNTCIIALHHIARKAASDNRVTLWSGQYAGEQEAEMVLGLTNLGKLSGATVPTSNGQQPRGERLRVSVLKNRNGRADPRGDLYVDLSFDTATGLILSAPRVVNHDEAKNADPGKE